MEAMASADMIAKAREAVGGPPPEEEPRMYSIADRVKEKKIAEDPFKTLLSVLAVAGSSSRRIQEILEAITPPHRA
jgi:hypothetical protein